MPDKLIDKKITQDEANQLMAPMELDLIALMKVIEQDTVTGLDGYIGTPEQYIDEVLNNLKSPGETGEMAIMKRIDRYKKMKNDIILLLRKALPPGTRRKRKDGIYEKQPDGKWKKITEGKKEEDKKQIESREHQTPPNEEFNQEFAINTVANDFQKIGISDEKVIKNTVTSIYDYTLGDYYKIRQASKNIDDKSIKDEYTEKARYIEKYLEIAPKYEGDVVRGIGLELDDIKAMLKSSEKIIDMQGMSSWSSNIDVAEKFLEEIEEEEVGIIFKISNSTQGSSITHLTNEPTEGEILFSKNQKYRIKDFKIPFTSDPDEIEIGDTVTIELEEIK